MLADEPYQLPGNACIHVQCIFNPSNAQLNPICHLLALLGAHHIFHVRGLRVNVQQVSSLLMQCIMFRVSVFITGLMMARN